MLKINLGSGFKRYPGFTNVDSFKDCNPDHVVNIETESLPFPDSSVDTVLAHHLLEHLGDGFFHAMKEIYRVCANDAVIDIHVPHPRHDTFLIDPTHKRPIYPHTLSMFSKKHNQHDIDNGGCETPIALMNDVDFEVVKYDFVLDPYFKEMFQTITEEQCEHIARTCNNVIVEIRIQLKVVK
jgi:ubiquinone/menaquinone biosynthesis C-methylase UbiE